MLEILVAGAIFSLVLAALYGVFARTLMSKGLVEERLTQVRAARVVLLRLSQDLQESFAVTPGDARFRGRTVRDRAFPQGSLSFLSLAQPPPNSAGRAGGVYEITYELAPDPLTPHSFRLLRSIRPDLAAGRTTAVSPYPLLTNVRGLAFRFFDGREWRDEWGQNNTRDKLPHAVEVILYLDDPQARAAPSDETAANVLSFSTVVDVPLAQANFDESRQLGIPGAPPVTVEKQHSAILIGTDLNGFNANSNPEDDIGVTAGTLTTLLGAPALPIPGLIPLTAEPGFADWYGSVHGKQRPRELVVVAAGGGQRRGFPPLAVLSFVIRGN